MRMRTIRGVLLRQGDSWIVRNSGGCWSVDGRVGIDEGTYVEAAAEGRHVDAVILQEAKPATFDEAVDHLLLSPRFPLIGWYDARRIATALGSSTVKLLRHNPLRLKGLVAKSQHVIAVWAGLGSVDL